MCHRSIYSSRYSVKRLVTVLYSPRYSVKRCFTVIYSSRCSVKRCFTILCTYRSPIKRDFSPLYTLLYYMCIIKVYYICRQDEHYTDYGTICSNLQCPKRRKGCRSYTGGVPDETPCGNGKWCMNGRCRSDDAAPTLSGK